MQKKRKTARRGFALTGELLVTITGLGLVVLPLVVAAMTAGNGKLVPELDASVARSKNRLTD